MGKVVLYVQGEKMMFISEDKELMKEWHPVLNKNLKPEEISVKSNKKVWWFCHYNDPETGEHDFVWQATVNSRRKNGCPYLTGRSVWKGYNDLVTRRPDIAAQWDLKKNGDLKPEDVTVGSKRKVWWILHHSDPETGEHDFSWQATVNNRVKCWNTKYQGCPYLAGKLVWKGYNDLFTRCPDLMTQWDKEQNVGINPENINWKSEKVVWWCLDYDDPETGYHHFTWIESIYLRSVRHFGCPFLTGKKVWKGYNDLATRRPDLAAQWDSERNGDLKPEDVTIGCKKKVWWIFHYNDPETGKYDFRWQATVNNRVSCDQGCPYLVGKAVLRGFNDLKSRYPELAMEWEYSKNRVLTPETVCVNSNKKVWWICSKGHRWRAKIQSRILGNGCPVCAAQKRKYGYFEG